MQETSPRITKKYADASVPLKAAETRARMLNQRKARAQRAVAVERSINSDVSRNAEDSRTRMAELQLARTHHRVCTHIYPREIAFRANHETSWNSAAVPRAADIQRDRSGRLAVSSMGTR